MKGRFETATAAATRRHGRAVNPLRRVVGVVLVALASTTGAAAAPKPLTSHLVAVKPIAAPNGVGDLCRRYDWACANPAGSRIAAGNVLALAKAVNAAVNAKVREVSDRRQYGREDVWALPTARGGDCEDFALAKKKQLIEAGVPPTSLLIATVLDRRRNPHAVLVLRTATGDYVLDNLTNRILPWQETGYSFLRMQNPKAPRLWDAILAGGIFARS
ncbi:transglutaminase-like cysteine peptidase [Defluviimonas sp. SAOS-178_SWC]|uniref:transglutaminase-like cysteine peptidase n=1 Tax=Defluviimonas sp. SAOS-178_SWC TaxID=3121287 RepID=UPI003221E70C